MSVEKQALGGSARQFNGCTSNGGSSCHGIVDLTGAEFDRTMRARDGRAGTADRHRRMTRAMRR
jgi:hypothetical protein